MARKVDGRRGSGSHNYGQENRGSKSPFKSASPMETRAPGERPNNRPSGPRLGSSSVNQGGGAEPSQSLDRASGRDEAAHSGRK